MKKKKPDPLNEVRKICAVGRAALKLECINEGWYEVSFKVKRGRDKVGLSSDAMSIDEFRIRRAHDQS